MIIIVYSNYNRGSLRHSTLMQAHSVAEQGIVQGGSCTEETPRSRRSHLQSSQEKPTRFGLDQAIGSPTCTKKALAPGEHGDQKYSDQEGGQPEWGILNASLCMRA